MGLCCTVRSQCLPDRQNISIPALGIDRDVPPKDKIQDGLALATLTLTPWLAVVSRVHGAVFTRRAIPALTFTERWLMNVSSVFFDPQIGRPGMLFDPYGRDVGLRWNEGSTAVIVLVVMLVVYALHVLHREAPRRVWMFVFVLVGVCMVFLADPDLLKGGQRSTTGRYLIPAYVGFQLAVASLLAVRVAGTTGSPGRRWGWRAVTAALITAGVLSCTVSAQSETWWAKYGSYHQGEVARFINGPAAGRADPPECADGLPGHRGLAAGEQSRRVGEGLRGEPDGV